MSRTEENAAKGKKSESTPLIKQYERIKAQHPDHILFFRCGDFYEMFFEDAKKASAILGITLTTRAAPPRPASRRPYRIRPRTGSPASAWPPC